MRLLVGFEPRNYPGARCFSAFGRCDFRRYDAAFLRRKIGDYDIIVPHLGVSIDRGLLARARRCRMIATPTTGRDHFDFEAALDLNIDVVSLNDDMAFLREITSTAEMAWLLILACLRRLRETVDRVALQASWDNVDLRGRQIRGLTIGIIGYGRLGRMVETYAHAFGMKVLVNDLRPVRPKHGRAVPLGDLLRRSDVVSLHAKWLPPEPPLIDARALGRMKRGAVLINTARGGLVDGAAAVCAVRSGRLAAIGADVVNGEYRDYRLPSDPIVAAARRDPRFVVTPHVGGATLDAHAVVFAQLARLMRRRLKPSRRSR